MMLLQSLLILLLISSAYTITTKEKPIVGSNINYPIRLAYIDKSLYWYGRNIAKAFGVPNQAPDNQYNYFALAFWSCNSVLDMASIWADAISYFTASAGFGTTTDQIQKSLRLAYNNAGKKIIVSAFGSTEFPTSSEDPVACAQKLGQFVLTNNLDGADIDYEDNNAMNNGLGLDWLVSFTKTLRSVLPGYIITHAPQAPYFDSTYYKNKSYTELHLQVGDLIDFYNIQFYNQLDDDYSNFTSLFEKSAGTTWSGTSVIQIHNRGIPLNKIVVGKPVTTADASNTGWVSKTDLASFFSQGFTKYGWYTGLMVWQFPSDSDLTFVSTVATDLINTCAANVGLCV